MSSPSGFRILAMKPSSWFSHSIVALSVSMSVEQNHQVSGILALSASKRYLCQIQVSMLLSTC